MQPILERYERESDAVLRDRAAVGRRRDRPARDAARARPRPRAPRPARRSPSRASACSACERAVPTARARRPAVVARPHDRPDRRNAFDAGADRGPAPRRSRVRGGRALRASSCWQGEGAVVLRRRRPRLDARRAELVARTQRGRRRARSRRCSRPIDELPAAGDRARARRTRSAAAPGWPAAATSRSRATDARFGFTEVRLGLIPADDLAVRGARGSAGPRPRALPARASCSTPTHALRIGLVHERARRRQRPRRGRRAHARRRLLRGGPRRCARSQGRCSPRLRDGDPAPQAGARGAAHRRAARVARRGARASRAFLERGSPRW